MPAKYLLTLHFKHVLGGFVGSSSRDQVFSLSKKHCVAVSNTFTTGNVQNVRLQPLWFYLFNVGKNKYAI